MVQLQEASSSGASAPSALSSLSGGAAGSSGGVAGAFHKHPAVGLLARQGKVTSNPSFRWVKFKEILIEKS